MTLYSNGTIKMIRNSFNLTYISVKGLSRRKCPVFQKTKLRILIIIWITSIPVAASPAIVLVVKNTDGILTNHSSTQKITFS